MNSTVRMNIVALCASASLLAISGPAFAQGSPEQSSSGSSSGQQQDQVQFNRSSSLGGKQGLATQPGQKQVLFEASHLIGKPVSSPQGDSLGKLVEIVFGTKEGVFGIVDAGGQLHPIPWQLITAVTPESVVANTTPSALSSAAQVQAQGNFAEFDNPQFTQKLYSHFKVQKESGMGSSGASSSEGSGSSQGSSSQQSGGSQSQGGSSQNSSSGSGQSSSSPEQSGQH